MEMDIQECFFPVILDVQTMIFHHIGPINKVPWLPLGTHVRSTSLGRFILKVFHGILHGSMLNKAVGTSPNSRTSRRSAFFSMLLAWSQCFGQDISPHSVCWKCETSLKTEAPWEFPSIFPCFHRFSTCPLDLFLHPRHQRHQVAVSGFSSSIAACAFSKRERSALKGKHLETLGLLVANLWLSGSWSILKSILYKSWRYQ